MINDFYVSFEPNIWIMYCFVFRTFLFFLDRAIRFSREPVTYQSLGGILVVDFLIQRDFKT